MTTQLNVMKLALEALVAAFQGKDKTGQVTDAITAIREALAEQQSGIKQVIELYDSHEQPAQQQEIDELTAQRDKLADILTRTANALKGQPAELSSHSWHDLPEVAQQLKTAQQQDIPKIGCVNHDCDKCKAQQQSAERGDPVAWVREHELPLAPGDAFSWVKTFVHKTPLYTTPQPAVPERKPLTDEEENALIPDPDGSAEANVRRVEVLPGAWGTEYEEVDAWSKPLVLQMLRNQEAKLKEKNNG